MGGRRGNLQTQLDIIISLILIVAFGAGTIAYIVSHSNGESFFSKVYSIDLSSSADVVAAGAGNVVLRYDNINPSLDLTYWVDNGRVAVGKSTASKAETGSAAVRFYGAVKSYPTGPLAIVRPVYLVLRKNGESLAITEAETFIRVCPSIAKPSVPIDKALVMIVVKKAPTQSDAAIIKKAFSDTLTAVKVTDDPKDKPNIVITLTIDTGSSNAITFEPTSDEGVSFACLLREQFGAVTLLKFAGNDPSRSSASTSGIDLKTTITLTNKDYLKPEQIGIALANAYATYYRGSVAGNPVGAAAVSGGTGVPGNAGDILLLGDSLTVGYSPFVGKTCGGRNVRVDAVTSRAGYEMLPSLNNDLKTKPGTVVILAGVNDMAKRGDNEAKVEATLTQLENAVKQQAPQTQVIFLTLVPWERYSPSTDKYQSTTDNVNAWLRGKGAIDVNSAIDANRDHLQDAAFCQKKSDGTCDMLHMNPKGYQLMASMVKERLGCASG